MTAVLEAPPRLMPAPEQETTALADYQIDSNFYYKFTTGYINSELAPRGTDDHHTTIQWIESHNTASRALDIFSMQYPNINGKESREFFDIAQLFAFATLRMRHDYYPIEPMNDLDSKSFEAVTQELIERYYPVLVQEAIRGAEETRQQRVNRIAELALSAT